MIEKIKYNTKPGFVGHEDSITFRYNGAWVRNGIITDGPYEGRPLLKKWAESFLTAKNARQEDIDCIRTS